MSADRAFQIAKYLGVSVEYLMTGKEIDLSKAAIKTLGGTISSVNNTFLPDSDIERSIVIINKSKPTPKLYPRKAGLPSKQPL